MRRGVVLALIVLAVAAVAAFKWWNGPGQKKVQQEAMKLAPKIHVANMSITDIDEDKIRMTSTTVLENNIPATIVIDSLNYEVYIEDTKIIESAYPKQLTLKKSDSTQVTLPLEVSSGKMKTLLQQFEEENRDSVLYTIKANFKTKLPVAGQRSFDINVSKRMPAPREIKVKPEGIDIKKLGLDESAMEMAVTVENKNAFPITLKDATYTVSVENDFEAEGMLEKKVEIPANGSETVSMLMKIKTAKVPKLGWKMLFREKHTNYELNFKGTIVSDNELLKNTTMRMQAKGTLDDIKELAKQ